MSYILSIETLRQVYTAYNVSSKFILATKSVVEEIGANELNAAKNSIADMKISTNPQRELEMGITQLRSAYEHFDSKSKGFFANFSAMKYRFQVSLLLSVCYYALSEKRLCEFYRQKSVENFTYWLEQYGECPSGKLHWKRSFYNRLKGEVKELGLSWTYTYPESHYLLWPSESDHKRFDQTYSQHKRLIINQFEDISKKLTI